MWLDKKMSTGKWLGLANMIYLGIIFSNSTQSSSCHHSKLTTAKENMMMYLLNRQQFVICTGVLVEQLNQHVLFFFWDNLIACRFEKEFKLPWATVAQ